MSYYLPFQGKNRFAAFKDTPEVESKLSSFVSSNPTWEKLYADDYLKSQMVNGESRLGISFTRNNSFVTTDFGYPQVDFDLSPPTLLFIYSNYTVSDTGSISFDNILPGVARIENSDLSSVLTPNNANDLWKKIGDLETQKADELEIKSLQNVLDNLKATLEIIRNQGSSVDLALNYLSGEEFDRKSADILIQTFAESVEKSIENLSNLNLTGVLDANRYPTRADVLNMILPLASKEYVLGFLLGKASETDFLNHLSASNPHRLSFLDVKSPSTSDFDRLNSSVNGVLGRVSTLESKGFVDTIQGVNGILATKNGSKYTIDSTEIVNFQSARFEEKEISFSGIATNGQMFGNWYPWNNIVILGIRIFTNTSPVSAPLVVDVNKNGTTAFVSQGNRPSVPIGSTVSAITYPDINVVSPSDSISVDIDSVGIIVPIELTIQIRYQVV